MRFLPAGRKAILVECESLEDTLALFHALSRSAVAGIAEIIPAARTLMIRFEPALLPREELVRCVRAQDISCRHITDGRRVEIPVNYNGEDLDEVADLLGLPVAEIVHRHTGSDYTVAFTGFSPGFAYLAGGDPVFNIPRRKTPRTHVPGGAVGLAGRFSGVYPRPGPGGWQIIGITQTPMFDPGRQPPALLQPGDRVRFLDACTGRISCTAPAGRMQTAAARVQENSQSRKKSEAIPALRAVSVGLPVLFQDQGRRGQASQGVSPSGALDRDAMENACRLVGNEPHSTVLEITLGSFTFEVLRPAVLALSGADCGTTIATVTGDHLKAGHNRPFAVETGDIVRLAAPERGMRSYLAIRGGFAAPDFLGSASRDTLACLGPEPVQAGDTLFSLPVRRNRPVTLEIVPAFTMPACGETIRIDVVMGPRTDWFTPAAVALFLSQSWAVTPRSDRVGMRLNGREPLERQNHDELPSEGTVTGAIQVPADGQPVLFLADRPLTGGYPVIATVADHHLDLAGQIPPGAFIRFFTQHPFTAAL